MKNINNPLIKTRTLVLLVLVSLLSGCQIFKREQIQTIANQSEQQRQLALENLQKWQIKGKFIFKSPQEKFSLSLNWAQRNERADIRLTTFLGISKMKMIIEATASTLEADGKTTTSDNPESLLLKTTGITLPVKNMPHWMKGLANPQVNKDFNNTTVLDEFNRVKQIKLLDANARPWQIDYQSYQSVSHYQLPKKIQLKGGDITIIIKISDWELTSD